MRQMCKSGRTIHSMRFVLEGWNGKQAHEWSDYSLNFDFDFKCEVCESNKSTNRNHGNHVFMFGTSKIWSVFYATIFFWNIFHQNFASSFLHIFVKFLQKSLILSFLGRWQLSRLGSVPTSVPSSGAVFFKKKEFHVFFVKFNNWYIDIYCNMQLIYCHNCFEASWFLVLFLYTFCIYCHIRIYIYTYILLY